MRMKYVLFDDELLEAEKVFAGEAVATAAMPPVMGPPLVDCSFVTFKIRRKYVFVHYLQ